MTAKEQLRRRVDGLTEGEAVEVLRVLERQAEDAGDRLDALLDSAPRDDEPWTAEDQAATAEALEDLERGDTIGHDELRRELLGH